MPTPQLDVYGIWMDQTSRARLRFERGRNLPHLMRENHPHFLTFRLADALPRSVLERFKRRRTGWLRRRGIVEGTSGWRSAVTALPPGDQAEFERRFAMGLLGLLDRGHGSCLLGDPRAAGIVADALRHFEGVRCRLGRFVVMPNHVHLLVTPLAGFDVRGLGESWRAFSARSINRLLGRSGRLWQPEGWDHLVRSEFRLRQIEAYIVSDGRHLPADQVLHG